MKKELLRLICCVLFLPAVTHAQFPAEIDLGNYAEDVRIKAGSYGRFFGSALTTGDFNGDGFNDILAGDYSYSVREDHRFSIGRAYIIFGGPALAPVIDLPTAVARVVTITGDDPRDFTAFSVGAGDVNGDGICDAIVGTSQLTHPIARGKLYIVYGRKNWPREISLDTDGGPVPGVTRVIGRQPGDAIGEISASGDIDGDGYWDVLIGAPNAGEQHHSGKTGEAYVLYGEDALAPIVDLGSTSARVTFFHSSETWQIGEYGACFDVNRDGYADVLLSDPFKIASDYTGGVLVLYGGDAALPRDIYMDDNSISSLQTTLISAANADRSGTKFACADMNGNGKNDLMIANLRTKKVSVLLDFPFAKSRVDMGDYAKKMTVSLPGDWGGIAAGDVNGDGFADLLAGSPSANVGGQRDGRTYVIFGSRYIHRGTFDMTRGEQSAGTSQISGYQDNQELGWAVACGDVNGDGIDDMLVGAPDTRIAHNRQAGEVYVIYGRSTQNQEPAVEQPQLLHNYPNPFNADTIIRYRLPAAQRVRLGIYNAMGQEVRLLVDGEMAAGEHRAIWDGHDGHFQPVGSGVYFCRMVGEEFTQSIKLLYLK